MHAESSVFTPSERVEIAYTGKPISGWGGLVLLGRFFDKLGIRELLLRALPDGRSSPNQISVVDIVLAFFACVLCGGRRFAHVLRVRDDEVVRAALGIKRMPSAMTLTRYFGGFVQSQVQQLCEVLSQFVLARLRPPSLGMVLDLDSTVFERYGRQEGSLKGHNPKKHGRPSHHPILAMLAEAKVVLHAWLRSGNSGTARGVEAFLAEALALLPEDFPLYAVRADSGFFIKKFLEELEQRDLRYAIAVRMNQPIKREIQAIREWIVFAPGLAVAEISYQAPNWAAPRRMAVVRETIEERPEARGRMLFEMPGYTFHAVVTNLPHLPLDVWRFYNSRADCENRLKELKEDFGANGFCLESFHGTDAVFRLICFLFNVMAEFKREVTQDERPRLMTLRTNLLVVGAILGSSGHKQVLRLGLRGRWRERFAQLIEKLRLMTPSTVMQSTNPKADQAFMPSAWRKRRRRERRLGPAWLPNSAA